MARTHTAEIIDIRKFLEEEAIPERVIQRPGKTIWRARLEPIDFEKKGPSVTGWSLVRDGQLIRIPLIPYRTPTQSPPEVLVSSMEVMARALLDFPKVERVHLVLGDPVEDLRPEADAFRYWVGIALQTT